MKKGILILAILALSIFLTRVNATSTGISAQWEGDMWDANGNKLNFNVFGFRTIFDATQGSGQSRTTVSIYFNSDHSSSGGGLPIENGKDYISFRFAIWTPLIANTTNDFSVSMLFWTQNNWGAGANCEVISDSSVELENSSKIAKLYVIKCPIINGTSSISNFNVSFNATNNTMYYAELSGDILTYNSVSTSDAQIIQKQQETIEAVQNQTEQIIEELNQTKEYNQTVDTNQIGANETIQAGQLEDELINATDFNESLLDGITINPNASTFIWNIVDNLRNMNISIVTLFTSIMGMGIIKLVLNR